MIGCIKFSKGFKELAMKRIAETKPSRLGRPCPAPLFLTGLLLALFLVSCGKSEKADSVAVRPVKTIRVRATAGNPQLTLPARVRASRRVELAFKEVSGPLVELPIEGREGKQVEKGELLARIDPAPYDIQLRNAQGALKEAGAALTLARREYERVLDIQRRDSGAVSAADVDRKREGFNAAEGRIRSLEAAVEDARNKLRHTELRAPFAGRVARRWVDNFQEIQPTQPVLALEDLSQVELLIDVPENVMATADKGDGEHGVSFSAQFPAAPGRHFPLALEEFATRADPATQTYQVVLKMAQPEGFNVITGMTASVTVAFDEQTASRQGVRVPAIAVTADPDDSGYVWVVDTAAMTVHKRPVKIGAVVGSEAVDILEGLQGGEVVVVAGLLKLHEGMPVRLWEEK
jgi:RND family efflux transporter MFP subunit